MDSLEVSRIRLEGRLSVLEAAPARYAALTLLRLVDWTEAVQQALLELEGTTAAAIAALERLFPGASLPAPEKALVEQVEHARGEFLVDLQRRLVGVATHWRNIDVGGLFEALREARAIVAAPLYTHPRGAVTEALGWAPSPGRFFEPCVLGRRGLLVGERLIPREDLQVSFKSDGPRKEWRIEPDVVLASDQVAGEIRRIVELMNDVDRRSFAAPPTPSTPVFVGTDLAITPPTHVVLITGQGLFHLPLALAFGVDQPALLGLVLAGLPGSHLQELLADLARRFGEHLPASELASSQWVFDGDRLRLLWKQAQLEVQLPAGEAKRASQFLAGLVQ